MAQPRSLTTSLSQSSLHSRASVSRRIARPTTATPQARAPVVLEFTETSLRCGIVGGQLETSNTAATVPKDIIPLSTTTGTSLEKEPAYTDPPSVWYRYLAPALQHAYQRLGLGARDRKVLVMFRGGYDQETMPRTVYESLLCILLDTIGVPAVNLQCSPISMVPYSLPQVSHLLVVYVGLNEASCLVHACGENLPFTYQNVPLGASEEEEKKTEKASFELMYLDANNPHSLVVALLKALQACPRSLRKLVVANIVFAGTGLLKQPHIPLRVVKQLQAILAAGNAPKGRVAAEDENPAATTEPAGQAVNVLVPIPLQALQGLSECVGLIRNPIRPDLLAWVGAMQRAAHWHKQDPLLQKWKWHTEWPLSQNSSSSSTPTPQAASSS